MSTEDETPALVLLRQGLRKSHQHDIHIVKKTDSVLGFVDSVWIIEKIHTFNGRPAQEEKPIAYSEAALGNLVNTRVAAGAKVIAVKGKPFPSGDAQDAVLIVAADGDWNVAKTAQPEKKIEPRCVNVTIAAGQVAPIW